MMEITGAGHIQYFRQGNSNYLKCQNSLTCNFVQC